MGGCRQAISHPRHGDDDTGICVAQRLAQFVNGGGQGTFDDVEAWPDGVKQFVLRDHFPSVPKKVEQHLQRLQLQLHRLIADAQLQARFDESPPGKTPNASGKLWQFPG